MSTLLLALAAVLGALFSAALGWLDSGEPFNGRKFMSSILRAIVAGLITAGGFITTGAEVVLLWDYFVAFLVGAGIDVFGHRLAGAVTSTSKTATPAPTPTPSPT